MNNHKNKKSGNWLFIAVMASTVFLMNCAKEGDKKTQNQPVGVVATETSATSEKEVSQNVSDESNPENIGICPEEMTSTWKEFSEKYKNLLSVKKLEKKVYELDDVMLKENGPSFLNLCEDVQKKLSAIRICKIQVDNKNQILSEKRLLSTCQRVGYQLQKNLQIDNKFANLYIKEKENRKSEFEESYKNKTFIMSSSLKDILNPMDQNFKKFIVLGQIKSSQEEFTKQITQGKTVCSFVGLKKEIAVDQLNTFKVLHFDDHEELDINYYVGSVAMAIEAQAQSVEGQKSGSVLLTLACTSLGKNKVDVLELKKTLGGHFITTNEKSALDNETLRHKKN